MSRQILFTLDIFEALPLSAVAPGSQNVERHQRFDQSCAELEKPFQPFADAPRALLLRRFTADVAAFRYSTVFILIAAPVLLDVLATTQVLDDPAGALQGAGLERF